MHDGMDARQRGKSTKSWRKIFNEDLVEMEIIWNEPTEIAKDCTRRSSPLDVPKRTGGT